MALNWMETLLSSHVAKGVNCSEAFQPECLHQSLNWMCTCECSHFHPVCTMQCWVWLAPLIACIVYFRALRYTYKGDGRWEIATKINSWSSALEHRLLGSSLISAPVTSVSFLLSCSTLKQLLQDLSLYINCIHISFTTWCCTLLSKKSIITSSDCMLGHPSLLALVDFVKPS